MNDLLKIIQAWADAFEQDFQALQTSLERKLRAAEGSLLRRILADVLPKMDAKDGRLGSGIRNMARVNLIERVFDELGRDETNAILTQYAEGLLGITGKNAEYYLATGIDKVKITRIVEGLNLVQEMIGIDKDGNLRQDGFLYRLGRSDEVRERLKQYARSSIGAKRKLGDFEKGLKELITGNGQEVNGQLVGYWQQYAYDMFSQAREVENLHFADELNLGNFIYTGPTLITSRKFCTKKKGKVFSREEANRDWPKDPDLINKKNVASYIPLIHRGRNNCIDFLMWISDELAAEMRENQKQ